MLKVKGIYDGAKIVLLEPVSLSPNTPVEILIPEPEQLYWQRLIELGLIKEVRTQPINDESFVSIRVIGEPISQTIIEERR
jgi:hypothetical protein